MCSFTGLSKAQQHDIAICGVCLAFEYQTLLGLTLNVAFQGAMEIENNDFFLQCRYELLIFKDL